MASEKTHSRLRAVFLILISYSAARAQSAPVRYTTAVHAGQNVSLSDLAYLSGVTSLSIGSKGEIYAGRNSCVFRIATDGSISRYAGICGSIGKSEDGGPATKAMLWSIGITADPGGNLYVAEFSYNRIRKTAPDGTISTFAGTGADGCTGDGGNAASAAFGRPQGLAADTKGTIYAGCGTSIRRISPDGKIATLVVLPAWEYIYSLACDQAGNVYAVAGSYGSALVHRISSDGTDVVIAGAGYSHEEGVPAIQSSIGLAYSVAVDADGNIYIRQGSRIRRIDKTGIIVTIAGSGVSGTVGDGGAASAASLKDPEGLAIDLNGNLVFQDSGTVRRILLKTAPPKIESIASYYTATLGDGPRATATFGELAGIARDRSGDLYVADSGYNRVRKIGTDDMVTTFAGNASFGFDGDGDARSHSLYNPFGLDFDSQGNLWVGDGKNLRLRKITSSGRISTEAGTGTSAPCFSFAYTPPCNFLYTSNIPPLTAYLNSVGFIKANSFGNVFFLSGGIYLFHSQISPNQQGTLFEVSNKGLSIVTSTAGGSGLPPDSSARGIAGIAFDSGASTYFATNFSIKKIDSAGVVTTFAGTPGKRGYSGDGGPAGAALLSTPSALTSDSQGNIYFIDGDPTAAIRKISRGGALIETVVSWSGLTDLVVDPAGVIYATSGIYVYKFTPVQADGISVLSGDLQIGSIGTQLPQPLVVRVAGQGGQLPFAGVTVQFKVASGVAKLGADIVSTGANGTASVGVTLGNQTGPVVVTASVPGLPSANFALTAQVPCSFTLNPTAISVPAAGAYGSVALTAEPAACIWSAASRDSWVTLTSAVTGTGSATIAFTVAPNPGTARTSALFIAGASVPVSQQAGPPGPLILSGGVVSAGSNLPFLAPGALATVYGLNLSASVAKASSVPLPASVGGASVSLGDRVVPLAYASPTQINFQVPYDTPLGTASLTVTANGLSSTPAFVTVASTAPGILTYGDNWAVIQNQDYSVNGPSNPAKVGSYVALYGTGAGAVDPAVPTGAAAPSLPLSTSVANVTASINGVPATITFAGLTPGNVGLFQVNLRIPALPSGTFPIQLTVGAAKSNAPSIAVQQ